MVTRRPPSNPPKATSCTISKGGAAPRASSSILVRRTAERGRCAVDDVSRLGCVGANPTPGAGNTLSNASCAAPRLPGSSRAEFRGAQGLTMSTNQNLPGALDGVRILDLTTMVAGPVATMMLADQGADVIKIESASGDLMRHFNPIRNGMSASFLSCNRNKRSLAVDLKSAEGLTIVQKLIATADVLVHT